MTMRIRKAFSPDTRNGFAAVRAHGIVVVAASPCIPRVRSEKSNFMADFVQKNECLRL